MSLHIHVWKSNLRGDGIRRWGLWEVLRLQGGVLLNEISAHIKETPQEFPDVAQQESNPTRSHEVVSSTPGLAQGVKNLALFRYNLE